MKKLTLVVCALLLLALRGHAFAQASCATNYTTACIGSTVCFTATTTSQQVLPPNLGRRYLLIQSQSTGDSVYFAIGPNTTGNAPINPGQPPPSPAPLVAVIGTNTIQLIPPSLEIVPNYELDALNTTPPSHVPTGAVAVITAVGSIGVCVMEHNG